MLPDGARIEQGSGNLDRLVLEADDGEAHVYLHGAHVTHFQPRGARPVLFLSGRSHFEAGTPGKAIRGGVPLCFPWFGDRAGDAGAPAHGFARTLTWRLGEVIRNRTGTMQATLHLDPNAYTRGLYPHEFAATLLVTVGARLAMELVVRNAGTTSMVVEEAFHCYFAVGDVRRVTVGGLEGLPYVDKTDHFARKPGESAPITIAGEIDRVYPGAHGDATISDPVWSRRIVVRKSGSATTVVWNPGADKARTMADLGEGDWQAMVCVEAANAMDDALTFAPGATHAAGVTIEVEDV
jgi:glucose-6-phosphate 1-epimerase